MARPRALTTTDREVPTTERRRTDGCAVASRRRGALATDVGRVEGSR